MSDLVGITDPEEKRKIIGRDFVEVFQEHAEKFDEVKWLAQGTIYPDVMSRQAVKPRRLITSKAIITWAVFLRH